MAQLLDDAYVDASFCIAGVAFSNELRICIDKRRGYLLRSEQLSKGRRSGLQIQERFKQRIQEIIGV